MTGSDAAVTGSNAGSSYLYGIRWVVSFRTYEFFVSVAVACNIPTQWVGLTGNVSVGAARFDSALLFSIVGCKL